MSDEKALHADDTVRIALMKMARKFEAAGMSGAQTDARFLLQGVLRVDGAALLREPEAKLGRHAADVTSALMRRLKHEPVSRILGEREFYGRRFSITPDVLDPRPDTEALVDMVLDVLRERGRRDQPLRIADIGTGSGAIICTLLVELPNASGVATDVSRSALNVAKGNADVLGVADRLRFFETRGLTGVGGDVDIVVSNPPYIASGEISNLDLDVRAHDPILALDGGFDGLQVYREIANDIRLLENSALVFLEVGADQAPAVEALFSGFGLIPRGRRADLGGHERVVALEHLR